jgi:hypothetical protein
MSMKEVRDHLQQIDMDLSMAGAQLKAIYAAHPGQIPLERVLLDLYAAVKGLADEVDRLGQQGGAGSRKGKA